MFIKLNAFSKSPLLNTSPKNVPNSFPSCAIKPNIAFNPFTIPPNISKLLVNSFILFVTFSIMLTIPSTTLLNIFDSLTVFLIPVTQLPKAPVTPTTPPEIPVKAPNKLPNPLTMAPIAETPISNIENNPLNVFFILFAVFSLNLKLLVNSFNFLLYSTNVSTAIGGNTSLKASPIGFNTEDK